MLGPPVAQAARSGELIWVSYWFGQ